MLLSRPCTRNTINKREREGGEMRPEPRASPFYDQSPVPGINKDLHKQLQPVPLDDHSPDIKSGKKFLHF